MDGAGPFSGVPADDHRPPFREPVAGRTPPRRVAAASRAGPRRRRGEEGGGEVRLSPGGQPGRAPADPAVPVESRDRRSAAGRQRRFRKAPASGAATLNHTRRRIAPDATGRLTARGAAFRRGGRLPLPKAPGTGAALSRPNDAEVAPARPAAVSHFPIFHYVGGNSLSWSVQVK